jgi:hypothetical protein
MLRILYPWHWHLDVSPRVPNTAWRSSELAWFAGTILTWDMAAPPVMWTR